jgi:DNA gyrase/topoisomerase IV subunit A
MKLQRLVSLEIEKLEENLAEIREEISYFKSILNNKNISSPDKNYSPE